MENQNKLKSRGEGDGKNGRNVMSPQESKSASIVENTGSVTTTTDVRSVGKRTTTSEGEMRHHCEKKIAPIMDVELSNGEVYCRGCMKPLDESQLHREAKEAIKKTKASKEERHG